MRNEGVAAFPGATRAAAAAGVAARVEATTAKEAAAAPVVPAVVATAVVANFLGAVEDATGGATSRRKPLRRRVT